MENNEEKKKERKKKKMWGAGLQLFSGCASNPGIWSSGGWQEGAANAAVCSTQKRSHI